MARRQPPDERRKRALWRGRRGEWLAALLLRLKGYRIVARNFRCRSGEIDLIARRGAVVAIVEVKARPSLAEALDAVGPAAQRRICAASDVWLSRQRDAGALSLRYDIVAILPRRLPVHVDNAWQDGG